MMNREVALTTSDNPYDPFDQFEEWNSFDMSKGYHTLSYLARVCQLSEHQSNFDEVDDIERVIDEIVELNLTGNYVKVVREF